MSLPAPLTTAPALKPEQPVTRTWNWRTWRRHWIVRDVLAPFVITRLLLCIVGWLALQAFADAPTPPGTWEINAAGSRVPIVGTMAPRARPFLNMWCRWDAGWYYSVARAGYNFAPGEQSNAAFFPAYPLAIRAAHVLFRHRDAGWFQSGLVVSNFALLLMLIYLVRLVRLDRDQATAARAALYVLVFPTTLFFSAHYSESIFLLFAISAVYYARRERWLLAGLAGALTTLSRPPAFLIAIPLLVEYLAARNFQLRRIRPDVLWLGLIPAALGGFMFYFQMRFGNMYAAREAQAGWAGWGVFCGPLYPYLVAAQHSLRGNEVVDLCAALLALLMTIVLAWRFRLSYGLYAIACYLFITSWGSFESMPRYILMIFPIFIAFADWGRKEWFHRAYLILGGGLAALFMVEFAMWRWVA